jgi:hypothetical protein
MTDYISSGFGHLETFAESQMAFELGRPSDKSVDEVLDAAADLIESDGHLKGQFFRQGEGYCALGAVRQVEFGCTDLYRNYDEDPQYFPITQSEQVANTPTGWLWSHLGQRPISHWNDATATTKDEVIQTLRDAATKYRNR